MLKVAIIIGSTRPGRKAEAVARWVYDIASKRSDAAFEIVDIKDSICPCSMSRSRRQWSVQPAPHQGLGCKDRGIRRLRLRDARVHHGPSAALKNAIDYPYANGTTRPSDSWAMAAMAGRAP